MKCERDLATEGGRGAPGAVLRGGVGGSARAGHERTAVASSCHNGPERGRSVTVSGESGSETQREDGERGAARREGGGGGGRELDSRGRRQFPRASMGQSEGAV